MGKWKNLYSDAELENGGPIDEPGQGDYCEGCGICGLEVNDECLCSACLAARAADMPVKLTIKDLNEALERTIKAATNMREDLKDPMVDWAKVDEWVLDDMERMSWEMEQHVIRLTILRNKAVADAAADKAADEAENCKQAVEGYIESCGEY